MADLARQNAELQTQKTKALAKTPRRKDYAKVAPVGFFFYIMLELLLGLHGKYLSIGQYTGYLRYLLLAAGIYVGTNDLRYCDLFFPQLSR